MKAVDIHRRLMQTAGVVVRETPQKAVLALSFMAPLVTIVATNAGIATREFWIYVAFYFPPTIVSMVFVGTHKRVLNNFIKFVTATTCLSNVSGFLLALTPVFIHGGRWLRPLEVNPAFSYLLWASVALWAFTVMLVFVMAVMMVDPDIQRQRRASELKANEALDQIAVQISRIFENSKRLQNEIRSDGAKLESALNDFIKLSQEIDSRVSAQEQKLSKVSAELDEIQDVEPENRRLALRLRKEQRAGRWGKFASGVAIGLAANLIFSFGHKYLSELLLDAPKTTSEAGHSPANDPSAAE